MFLLLRLLPAAVGLVQLIVFTEQVRHPLLYPWIALIGILALPAAAFAIAWGRIHLGDMNEKMTPSFMLVSVLAFSLLMLEGAPALWLAAVLAAAVSYFSLEMLFLNAYVPARYPVHGISRLNIAYVPIVLWYAAATSAGLLVFLHSRRIWHILGMMLIGILLYRTTGHPGATRHENRTWMCIGGLVGLHVGLLGVFLPFTMAMQGMVAAVLFSAMLRVRRYLYDPKPSRRQAWTEGVSSFAALVLVVVTAPWT